MRQGLVAAIVFPLLATVGLGVVQPQQARAGDTLKVLAGVAAGVLVYHMLDKADEGCREVHYYYDDWGAYERYGRVEYYYPGQGRGPVRRAYNEGYRDGWEDGERVGYNRGYRDGYWEGYDDGREDQWWIDHRHRRACREPEPWEHRRRR
ncbi:MAG: hypothetical protein N2512_13200 [Armatimonadetes bacterium]|nr:hypothetical protein [Armatimonadota bacterium]